MLDISIQNIDKIDFNLLFNDELIITEKLDGTKLTLVRTNNDYDPNNFSNNFIIAYKGTVLYQDEFIGLNLNSIKKNSIGIFQYALVFEHFKVHNKMLHYIPKNTEFFIEFIQQKPTITRDYKIKHKMCLIGYTNLDSYEIKNCKLITKSNSISYFTHNLIKEVFATQLCIDLPKLIFSGNIQIIKERLKITKREITIEEFKKYILSKSSMYGGKIEGVVIYLPNHNQLIKVLQDDQHDKNVRFEKKLKFESIKKIEDEYFLSMKNYLLNNFINKQAYWELFKKFDPIRLNVLANNYKLFKHEKKNSLQIHEDFHYIIKYLYIKQLEGTNNCLIIGRMQPPTIEHLNIIKTCAEQYDNVYVTLSKNKNEVDKNPYSLEQRYLMLASCNLPKNVYVTECNSGNIFYIQNKLQKNINVIACGFDRVEDYKRQLLNNPEIKIKIFKRTKNSISSTKVRQAIKNKNIQYLKNSIDPNVMKYLERLAEL